MPYVISTPEGNAIRDAREAIYLKFRDRAEAGTSSARALFGDVLWELDRAARAKDEDAASKEDVSDG